MDGRQRVREALSRAGMTERIRELEQTARTAADAAAALGCAVGAIGSSLVFLADGQPVLVVTSGAHRVDLDLVAQELGSGPLAKATAEQVRALTGFSVGAVAPVGHTAPLTTLIDEDLAQHPQIWTAAGHTHAVFWSSYAELLDLTGGRPVRVAE